MKKQRFEDITAGLEINDKARERQMERVVPADRTYVILFSARSGSTWLTSTLSATKRLGRPEEYLNPGFLQKVAKAANARTPDQLLEMLKRRRKSANGVFGMETRAVDIDLLGFQPFAAAFGPETVFFHLWRENLIAQGISLFRAVATSLYHSSTPSRSAVKPDFDADGIFRWVRHVANTENANARMLQRLRAPARHLCYETIVGDRVKTVSMFARVLGLADEAAAFDVQPENEPGKLADDWNTEAEARFRAERPDDVASFEGGRLIKLGVPHNAAGPAHDAMLIKEYQRGASWGRAGRSMRDNPFDASQPQADAWRAGWGAGWDDQKYIGSTLAVAATGSPRIDRAALPPLPPEAPNERLLALGMKLPNPLPEFTAQRLRDLVLVQQERSVTGALIELGLSRGRQSGLLLQAARTTGSTVCGIDLTDGKFGAVLRPHLELLCDKNTIERWLMTSAGTVGLDERRVGDAAGSPARLVCIDATHARGQIGTLLTLAESVLAADGCIAISDFLGPLRLDVTEGLFRFLAVMRRVVPFALLPGRLLLAPVAAAAIYRAALIESTLAEQSPIAVNLRNALDRDNTDRVRQNLAGYDILVLG